MNPLLKRYALLGHTITFKKTAQTIRVNTLLTTSTLLRERFIHENIELLPISFTSQGFTTTATRSLASTTPYLLGHFYIQEPAAQLPAEVLNPQPGETILDLCAAPGGKTTQLSQLMNNAGSIHSYESQHHRIPSLLNNLERMNATNVTVHEEDALSARGAYDKILLDAPCSGNLAADEHWLEKRTLKGIQDNAEQQQKLLNHAITLCNSEGTIVYATCSLEPEENERVVNNALKQHPEIALEKISLSIGSPGLTTFQNHTYHPSLALTKRFWPDEEPTQGFYIAKLRKVNS